MKHAAHEQQETVQRRNAKAQRDRERRRCHLLMEKGSENEDEEDNNKDEGQHTHVEEDEDEDEDEDIHVGYPTFFLHLLTDRYNQFSSEIVRSKLSAVSSQQSDSSSQ